MWGELDPQLSKLEGWGVVVDSNAGQGTEQFSCSQGQEKGVMPWEGTWSLSS